jgi:dTDP-4-amino-4,6-dideoxygalactose transaminase
MPSVTGSPSTTVPASGHEVSRLEHELAERVGRSHCVATGSGTMALTVALEALGLPPGSEVIVPSVCCPAVPFAVAYAGLVPVFCDISRADYVLDAAAVDAVRSERTRAFVGVHLFGNPAPVDDLVEYARSRSLSFIEDVAQAFGGRHQGEMLGRFGTMSITSFRRGKILSASGGGAIFTDDADVGAALREALRAYSGSGSTDSRRKQALYEYLDPTTDRRRFLPRAVQIRLASRLFESISFRPLEPLQAQVVSELLPDLDATVETHNRHASMYRALLSGPGLVHPTPREGGVCFRYTVRLEDDARSRIRRGLIERGIWVSALYPALHEWYGSPQHLPVTESVAPRLLNLPVAPPWDVDDVERIATTLTELLSLPA